VHYFERMAEMLRQLESGNLSLESYEEMRRLRAELAGALTMLAPAPNPDPIMNPWRCSHDAAPRCELWISRICIGPWRERSAVPPAR
jgi:hypothetical protein